MIIAVLILFGVLLGLLGGELIRRATAKAGNPMLDALRATLEEMERDYRLRVATEDLTRDVAFLRLIRGPDGD
jgi:DNA-binding GntR family transcriptional regulator